MSATKSYTSVLNAVSSLAGSTYASPSTGCQSSFQSLTTQYGSVVSGRITPSATLTTGCTVYIDISPDGTIVRQFAQITSGLVSGQNYDFTVEIPAPVMYVRVTFAGNVGNTAVGTAEIQSLTGI